MVAYCINAFDVKWTDARRAPSVGFLLRGFSAFWTQLPRPAAPEIDQASLDALGSFTGEQRDKSDSPLAAAGRGGGADAGGQRGRTAQEENIDKNA